MALALLVPIQLTSDPLGAALALCLVMADAIEAETCHLSIIGDVHTSTSAQIVIRIPPAARRFNVGIWDDTSEPVRTLVDETDLSTGSRLLSH